MSLDCREISYAYNGEEVLHNVALSLPGGTFCALLGRNGSGKTTLLHCLCGILNPGQGQIRVNQQEVSKKDRSARARSMSLVPQEFGPVFPFRVLDMVLMGRNPYLRGHALPGPKDEEIAWRALRLIGAEHLARRRVNRISGGERQLATVARALAQQAPLMLLDEPSNHLDFHNQYRLLYRLRHLCHSQGLTVLASMHDPNAVAAVADRVVLLASGKVVGQGQTRDILTKESLSRLYGMPVVEYSIECGGKYFMPRMDEIWQESAKMPARERPA